MVWTWYEKSKNRRWRSYSANSLAGLFWHQEDLGAPDSFSNFLFSSCQLLTNRLEVRQIQYFQSHLTHTIYSVLTDTQLSVEYLKIGNILIDNIQNVPAVQQVMIRQICQHALVGPWPSQVALRPGPLVPASLLLPLSVPQRETF